MCRAFVYSSLEMKFLLFSRFYTFLNWVALTGSCYAETSQHFDSLPLRRRDESMEPAATCEQSHHLTADPDVPDRCSLKPLRRSFDHQRKLAFIWPSPLISACRPFFSPSVLRDLLFSSPPPFDLRRPALVFMYAATKREGVWRAQKRRRCAVLFLVFLNGWSNLRVIVPRSIYHTPLSSFGGSRSR